ALVPAINHKVAARDVQRRTRRIRRFAALAVLLFLTASALVAVFAYLLSNASNANLIAESRQLVAGADLNLARDRQLSALLAMRALRLPDTSQAEAALRDALPQIQAVRTFRTGTTASWAAFDPLDLNKVASAGKDGAAAIWDVTTGRR